MRPVRLVAEGFSAFRDPIDVHFDGADFFALVGPTGSGKSSILDAICFALYGNVPRYGDDRLVAPVITQGSAEARVSLTFEIEREEYVATRVVRRQPRGGATTKEARLEHGAEVLAGDAKGMNKAVADLIGLSFHHFTRCVVLPQGEFAEFLHDKPSERQDLIVKLLDLQIYERMRSRATARAAQREGAIALDEQRIGALADCTPEAEAQAHAVLDGIKQLRKQLQKAETAVKVLEEEAATAARAADTARQVVVLLEAVKVPKAVLTLNKQRDAAVAARADAALAREASEAALAEHAQVTEQLPDPAQLQHALDAYCQLDEISEHLAALTEAEQAALPALEAGRAAHDEAVHAVGHAEAAFEAGVEDSAATALAAALVVGEPCPVCEQVVTRKPKVRAGEKGKAKKALDAARKQEALLRAALEQVETAAAKTRAEHEAAEKRARALEQKVAKAPDAERLAAQLAEIEAARQEHAARQAEFQRAVGAEREAGERVTALDRDLAQARQTCDAQRDPLVGAGLDVPGIGADFVADWESMAGWSAEQVPTHKAREREQTEHANQRAEAARVAVAELVETATASGVEVPRRPAPTISGLRELAAASESRATAEANRIADGIKESAAITKRIETARDDANVARELAKLLRSDRFEQWVVNEALVALVEGASETLEQLSSNQYALGVDDGNEFEVIDHRNADERRSAKTLSGGETFQASLALSLALADQVGSLAAGGAAKLDAIFLDEGFGTLDPDCLDTVAATLETLGSDARMVGIVTHVRDLADRVPVRFEVTKGPRTSSVTRVDA